jgi:hypothetical protein
MADAIMAGLELLDLKPSPFGNLLFTPGDRHFGPEEPDADEMAINGLKVRLGDRPLARNLRRLYEKAHKKLPPNLSVYDSYDLFLIPHSVGLLRKSGTASVKAVGYEADFGDAEQVYTLEMLPQTRFVTRLDVSLHAEADLAVEGHAEVPAPARALLDVVESVGGDARLKLSAETKVLGRVSFSLLSPVIQSVGVGKSRIEWKLEADNTPLLGDQMLLQTVAVPLGTESITMRSKAYVLLKPTRLSWPAMFETRSIEVTCPLPQ